MNVLLRGAYMQLPFRVTKGCIYATPFPHQVAQVSNDGFAQNSSSSDPFNPKSFNPKLPLTPKSFNIKILYS